MKLISSKRRMAVIGLTVGLIAGASGLAFAYFTSSGSGNGSAQTGKASTVSISQVGAGYDSLRAAGSYTQDQCLSGCTGPQELGNAVTLSTSDASQLTTAVVAIDNWGAAATDVPMTFWINNSVGGGPVTATVTSDFFAAAINPSSDPSVTDVTFDFTSQGAFVGPNLVYGITFNTTADAPSVSGAGSLNVALASSATDISVGTDTAPGTIWMDDTYGNNNDFPSCMSASLPTAGFVQVATNCGAWSSVNPGAYGNEAVTDDIPAVEINVVGGTVTGLYPGDAPQPILFAITNSGTSPVQVGSVGVAVNTNGTDVETPTNVVVTGCSTSWYQINNSAQTLSPAGGNIPPGTTLFTLTTPVASDLSIQMLNVNISQDDCEGVDVGLTFTSN